MAYGFFCYMAQSHEPDDDESFMQDKRAGKSGPPEPRVQGRPPRAPSGGRWFALLTFFLDVSDVSVGFCLFPRPTAVWQLLPWSLVTRRYMYYMCM